MDKLGDDGRARTLVAEVLAGRREAFAELVGMFQLPVYNLALRMTGSGDQADELSQEIFTRAWLNLPAYDPARPFFTWLYTLALNMIRNQLARNYRLPPSVDSGRQRERADEHPEADPLAAVQRRQQQDDLLAALRQLPMEQREALLLRYYQEIAFADLAAILEISESAAKMRVSRGLTALRDIIVRQKKL